jgi:hypothetical protein
MEYCWSDTNGGKAKHSEKNLSQCHFAPHKSHVDCCGLQLGTSMGSAL